MENMKLEKLVLEEIQFLRNNLTIEEKERLNYKDLDPEFSESCIYGLATGNCHNLRAIYLMSKLNTLIYSDDMDSEIQDEDYIENSKIDLNAERRIKNAEERHIIYFTPLELYIIQFPSKNREIIDYIKGDKDSITLD